MAYPTHPPVPESRRRPAAVTASTWLLWATAAISLVEAGLAVAFIGPAGDAANEVGAGTPVQSMGSFIVGAAVVVAFFTVVIAAGFAILAIYNNRGRNGARITTWVLGGLMVCCGAFSLLFTGIGSLGGSMATTTGGGADQQLQNELIRRLEEAIPGWVNTATTVLSTGRVLIVLVALVLLALPASNEFFARAAMAWDPNLYPYANPYGAPPAGGAPPVNPYGAPPVNPYGVPPAGAPLANPYAAPPENPYGVPPAGSAGAPPADPTAPGGPPSSSAPDDPSTEPGPSPSSEPPAGRSPDA